MGGSSIRSGEGHGVTGQGKCPPRGEGLTADSPKSRGEETILDTIY